MSKTNRILPGMKGKQFRSQSCLLSPGDKTVPAQVNVDPTAAAAKGATSITIAALPAGYVMLPGQPLHFVETDDTIINVVVSQKYVGGAGATVLNVKPLDVAIPDTAMALFPAPNLTRQTFDVSGSAATQELSSYEHPVKEVTAEAPVLTFSSNGYYNSLCTWQQTATFALDNNLEVGIREVLPPPSGDYVKGEERTYAVIITSTADAKPEGGPITFNASGNVNSAVKRTPPVAA
jgi:hypothetical protein